MAKDVIVFHSGASSTTPVRFPSAYHTTVTHRGMASILVGVYRGYCVALFKALAAQSPDELVDIVRESRAPSSRLTYGAEILGREVGSAKALDALRGVLSEHPSALVREGAVLGLEPHRDQVDVNESLRIAARRDPSPGVQSAAAEALEG